MLSNKEHKQRDNTRNREQKEEEPPRGQDSNSTPREGTWIEDTALCTSWWKINLYSVISTIRCCFVKIQSKSASSLVVNSKTQ